MKRILAVVLLLAGCVTYHPVKHMNTDYRVYDKDTEYTIVENDKGFEVEVSYSKYQYAADFLFMSEMCRQQLYNLSMEFVEEKGKRVKAIDEKRIKVSPGRNEFTGVSSCTAYAEIKYI